MACDLGLTVILTQVQCVLRKPGFLWVHGPILHPFRRSVNLICNNLLQPTGSPSLLKTSVFLLHNSFAKDKVSLSFAVCVIWTPHRQITLYGSLNGLRC